MCFEKKNSTNKKRKKNTGKKKMQISEFQHIGERPYQEDKIKIIRDFANQQNLTLVIVCDGHGGQKASDMLVKRFPDVLKSFFQSCKGITTNYAGLMGQALEQCIQEWDKHCFGSDLSSIVDKQSKKKYFKEKRDHKRWKEEDLESGSTICCTLFDQVSRKLYILNLGDSRACWFIGEKLIGSTVDHSVPKIMTPIKHFPFKYGNGRIEDDLGMCRSFGDNTKKLFRIVSRQPDLLTVKIGNMPARLVVATDGFFDFVTNHGALYDEVNDATELSKKVETFDDNISIVYLKIPAGLGEVEKEYAPMQCAVLKEPQKKLKKSDKVQKKSDKKKSDKAQRKSDKTKKAPKNQPKKSIKRNQKDDLDLNELLSKLDIKKASNHKKKSEAHKKKSSEPKKKSSEPKRKPRKKEKIETFDQLIVKMKK